MTLPDIIENSEKKFDEKFSEMFNFIESHTGKLDAVIKKYK